AAVIADPLVTTGAERPRARSGEDDDPDRLVLPGEHERPVDLDQGLRTERVVHLGTVDGDLGDSVVGGLVADVVPLAVRAPRGLLGHAPIIVCWGFATAGPPADGVAGRAAAARIHRTRRPPRGVEGPRPDEPPGGGAPGSLIRRGRALAARRPCGRTVPGRSSLLGERDAGEPVPRLARFALLGVRAVFVHRHRARSSVSQVERHRGLRLPVAGRIGGEVQPDLVLRVGVRRVDRRLLRVLLVLEVRTRVVTRLTALVHVDVRAVLTVRN